MTISSVTAPTIQAVDSINPKTNTGIGFSVNRYMSQTDAMTSSNESREVAVTKSDTVSISAEGRSKAIQPDAKAVVPQELKSLALPSWLAPYYLQVSGDAGKMNNVDRSNARFNALSSSEQKEYFQLVDTHFKEMLDENNLTTNPDRFELLVNSKNSSELYRADFEKRVAADSRLSALIAKMS